MSIRLIHQFCGRAGRHFYLGEKRAFVSLPFPSILRQRSSPADTHDEDPPESAWSLLDIPRESDVVVFAAAPAGHLPALEALVPDSHVALPDSSGFSTLLEFP
jgi:hypothetical protein